MVTVPGRTRGRRASSWPRRSRALAHDNIPAGRPKLGIMVEVPAAAIAIDQFDADFFSIGSNDLTQYVTAGRPRHRRRRRSRRPAQPRGAAADRLGRAPRTRDRPRRQPLRRRGRRAESDRRVAARRPALAVRRARFGRRRQAGHRRSRLARSRAMNDATSGATVADYKRAPAGGVRQPALRDARAACRRARHEPLFRVAAGQSGLCDADPGPASGDHFRGLPLFAGGARGISRPPMTMRIRAGARPASPAAGIRVISLAVPDLGSARRNQAVDAMIAEYVRHLVRLAATMKE